MNLSNEQQTALDLIMNKIKSSVGRNKQFIYRVGGYAGTGKTHLLCELRYEINILNKNINVAFATFTGKAASVLKHKMIELNSIRDNDYIGTIHGLIYKPKCRYDKKLKTWVVVGWKLIHKNEFFHDLVIIDEGSMVSKDIWKDLIKFGVPIIVVGDHGQLPPISETAFSLMTNPDYVLQNIHRQAKGNPIIQLSAFIRKNGYIPNNVWSKGVFKIPWDHNKTKEIWNNLDHDKSVITLCGFNTTRCGLNRDIRSRMKYSKKTPYPGERVVCLKNNHKLKIMNGQIATMMWLMNVDKDVYRITIDVDNEPDPYECMIHFSTFDQVTYTTFSKDSDITSAVSKARKAGYELDFFDYGYCISVHKSQGSEWDKVILFEQRTSRWDDEYYKRWLYTGVTRAKEKLMVISDYWG